MQNENVNEIGDESRYDGPIRSRKYELVRDFIIGHLDGKGESSFVELLTAGKIELAGKFVDEELSYLLMKVKADLETNGVIEKSWRPRHTQVLRLKRSYRMYAVKR
jgi:hypothetical protein